MTEELDLRRLLPGVEISENEPMAAHTTFRIGGPARWFLQPGTAEQAAGIIRLCKEKGIAPFYLGNGSNLLVSDEGFDGIILSTAGLDQIANSEDGTAVCAGSGVLLSRLANFAADLGLSGLEFASGIPGSLGGALRMNAGAYGGEMAQVARQVDFLDETGEAHTLSGEECRFAYRHSIFCEKPWLITGALLRLTRDDPDAIRGRMAELTRRRREKQPLEYPSAGSAFKRPPNHFAAALIDQCGLKGLRVGDAQVSEKHSGFVVNLGHATAADVLALMDEVKRRVYEAAGVILEPEVEVLK